jgi:ABC-type Na+ efflux pump permease subunit
MNKIWIICQKEVLDSLRDYRSWSTGLFWAIFGPLMMGGMLIMIGSSFREDVEKSLNLPVQNSQNAPGLIQFLQGCSADHPQRIRGGFSIKRNCHTAIGTG